MAEQVHPEHEEDQRAQGAAFNLGHLTIGEILRLNRALSSEANEYSAAASHPESSDEPRSNPDVLISMFDAAIANLIEADYDKSRALLLALRDDEDPYSHDTALSAAQHFVERDPELAQSVVIDLQGKTDTDADIGAKIAVEERLPYEQRAAFIVRVEQRREEWRSS